MKVSQVTDRIYRGPHPLTDADMVQLKGLGVSTLLNLERGWFETFTGRLNWEIINGVKSGITVLHLQLADVFAPTSDQLDCALSILKDTSYGKIYVHCLHGVDRTGEVCCAERVLMEGWSVDKAVQEMFDYGYHKVPYQYLWLPSLKRYLQGNASLIR